MDGYTLTEKMRKARRSFRFTATEQALFYELVAICNGEDWRDVFDCSNVELCYALNINEKTLVKARETLINAGLVYYKSGKSKRIVSSYSFEKPFKMATGTTAKNTVDKGVDKGGDKGVDKGTNSTDYNKLKTKQNSSPSHARVGELFPADSFFDKSLDECYTELKSNQSWAETVTMNTRSAGFKDFTLEAFYGYLEQFFMEQQNKGETSKSPKDAMSHFASWLKIELNNKKNERRTNKKGTCNGVTPQSTAEGSLDQPDWLNEQAGTLEEFINSLPIGR